MTLIICVAIAAVFVIAMILKLALEQRDKNRRARRGLPARRYHDVSDYDIYTVYTNKIGK